MVGEADDQQQFAVLFEKTYARLLAYVGRRVPAEQAHDLIADVYLSAWTSLHALPADPLPWLYRAAWNAVGNYRRAVQRSSSLTGRLMSDATTDPSARDPGDLVASADRAQRALSSLRGKDREVIQLLCWEQLSVSDAARVLGCSETALTVRLHRARRRLAARLASLDGAGDDLVRLPAILVEEQQT